MTKKPYPTSDPLGQRIAEACDLLGERQQAAAVVGVTPKHLRRVIQGESIPGVDILARLADATGYSIDWIMTGRGPRKRGGAQSGTDPELLGRLVDALRQAYADEGVALPDVELGRMAAVEHDAIVTATPDPDERIVMVKLVVSRHAQALRTERADSRGRGA